MNQFIKDWKPGSMPDGSDPPRITPAAKWALGISIAVLVAGIVLMATGVI